MSARRPARSLVLLLLFSTTLVPLASAIPDTHTEHGNNTATAVWWEDPADGGIIVDTHLDSNSVMSSYDADPEMLVGHDGQTGQTTHSLVAFDFSRAGFWTNATIQHAQVELRLNQIWGTPVIHAWLVHNEQLDVGAASWRTFDGGQPWQRSGAVGVFDSGMRLDSMAVNGTMTGQKVAFNVTEAMILGQDRWMNGPFDEVAILFTAAQQGHDGVRFASSQAVFADHRPAWNVTVSWASPARPSGSAAFIDLYPKWGADLDADDTQQFDARIRNGRGQDFGSTGISWTSDRGSIDATGMFTPGAAGLTRITATDGALSTTTGLEVLPGPLVDVTLTPQAAEMSLDDQLQFTGLGLDAAGNHITGLSFDWSVSDGSIDANGLYTPASMGEHTIQGRYGTHTKTTTVEVGPGHPAVIQIPADMSAQAGVPFLIIPSLWDAHGNPIDLAEAAGIDWEVESGSIDSAGFFVGNEVGVWNISAVASTGARGDGTITVTPGRLVSLSLSVENTTVAADEIVDITLLWEDMMGNIVPTALPLANWSAEDGSFRLTAEGVEWVPARIGTWEITVHQGEVEASITLNVTEGTVQRIVIDADHEILSADDEIELRLFSEDLRGNRLAVDGTWTLSAPTGLNSTLTGEAITFPGGAAGTWAISASHEEHSASIDLEVNPGRLARILVTGEGMTISADESLDLDVRGEDAKGNPVTGVQYNFSIDGEDKTLALRTSRGVWSPSTAGDHLIEVSAAGRSARARVHVEAGDAHRVIIQTEGGATGAILRAGEAIEVEVLGEDLSGNRFAVVAEWSFDEGAVAIEPGLRQGTYRIIGMAEGIHTIVATNGSASGEFDVQNHLGDPWSLQIRADVDRGEQGQRIPVTIRLLDRGGNALPLDPRDVEVDTEVGRIMHHEGDAWWLHLDNHGEHMRVSATSDGLTDETFLNVDPTGLSKLMSSALGTALLGLFLFTAVAIAIAAVVMRRNATGPENWEDEWEFYDDIPEESTPAVVHSAAEVDSMPQSRHARRRMAMQRRLEREKAMMASAPPPAVEQPVAQTQSVLTAMQGTVQGQTGWYADAAGNPSYWQVNADGSWTQIQ